MYRTREAHERKAVKRWLSRAHQRDVKHVASQQINAYLVMFSFWLSVIVSKTYLDSPLQFRRGFRRFMKCWGFFIVRMRGKLSLFPSPTRLATAELLTALWPAVSGLCEVRVVFLWGLEQVLILAARRGTIGMASWTGVQFVSEAF